MGRLSWCMRLDLFGRPSFEVGGPEDCPWRWPGQYHDVETHQFYNRWRYYDPESGVYVSRDPVGLLGGLSLFGYVADPVLDWDPDGLTAWRRGFPYGFQSLGQFNQFASATRAALTRAGYGDVNPLMQGSAVTGVSHDTRLPFDVGRRSDFDVALSGESLFRRAEELGLTKGNRTGPLDPDSLRYLGLSDAAERLSRLAGREVNFMIFQDVEAARAKASSFLFPNSRAGRHSCS